MDGVVFLIVLAVIWIVFASVQDLRKREVANWLSFSLIVFALGFRFFYSLFELESFMFFYQGLIGLGIFLVLGNLFYYARLFAGGDAKLMIALGAVLPFSESFYGNVKTFIWFFGIFLFVGAVYGLAWSVVLSLRNFTEFKKEFARRVGKSRKLIFPIMLLGLVLMIFGFFESLLFFSGALVFILPYFYIYAKSVEEVCMVKEVNVKNLVEGDWLYEDIKIGNKIIKSRWDGLNEKQIKNIQKKYKKIKVKQGIPFVPVFLISFLILIIWKVF